MLWRHRCARAGTTTGQGRRNRDGRRRPLRRDRGATPEGRRPVVLAVCPVQSENGRDNTHGLGCRSLYAPQKGTPNSQPRVSDLSAPEILGHRAGCGGHPAGRFSHTEMCDGLVEVNGSRVQVAQRSLSVMPACRAMRSSSEGDTYL